MRPRKLVVLTADERQANAAVDQAGHRHIAASADRARHVAMPDGLCAGCRHNGLDRRFDTECARRAR